MKKLLLLTALITAFSSPLLGQCDEVNVQTNVSTIQLCGSASQTFSINNTSTGVAASAASYQWLLDGNAVWMGTGLNSQSFTIDSFGTHQVTLIATGEGCTEQTTINVHNHAPITPSITVDATHCLGSALSFNTDTNGHPLGTTYLWNFGNGQTSTSTNPSYNYTTAGTYNVELTVTIPGGCSYTATQTVIIHPSPVINFFGENENGTLVSCSDASNPVTTMTIDFTNYTTGATSYLWDFGNGTTSTLQNPSVTYTSFGSFPITLTATNDWGCSVTSAVQTAVLDISVAAGFNVGATGTNGCAPFTLNTISNTSAGNIETYRWDFGGGAIYETSSATPPSHTYNVPGNYSITLTVSNGCGFQSATVSPIQVYDRPQTNFTIDDYVLCAPQTITFTNGTTGAASVGGQPMYVWTLPNGSTSTSPILAPQTHNTVGNFDYTLTAYNACGERSLTRSIRVDSIPNVKFTVTPNDFCSPQTVSIVNQSTPNSPVDVSYYWSWTATHDGDYTSDNYSYAQNINSLNYNFSAGDNPISGSISLRITNGCGTFTKTEPVVIHRPTDTRWTASSYEVCVGTPINFNNTSLGEGKTFEWNFSDGFSTTDQNISEYVFAQPGTYTVNLTTNAYCGPDELERTILVKPYPVADIMASTDSLCLGDAFTFVNNSTPSTVTTGSLTHTWTYNVGQAPAITSNTYNGLPEVIYTTQGYRNVIYTINWNGCIDRDTLRVGVNPNPEALFTLNSSGCSPLTVDFVNESVEDNDYYTYQWDLGNTTFTGYAPTSQVYTTSAGAENNFDVSLTITTIKGCTDTHIESVSVKPLPVAGFTIDEPLICGNVPTDITNTSTGATDYIWDFGNGQSSNEVTPGFLYYQDGTYTITLTAVSEFGCEDQATGSIMIDPIPTADFEFTTICKGFETEFNNTSAGNLVSYAWAFNDAELSSATTQDATFAYTESGVYPVSLIVWNTAGCSDTITQNVTVLANPVADFSAQNFCLDQTTQFQNTTAGTTVNWTWDLGNGQTASADNASTIYASVGTYEVSLIVENDLGCLDTLERVITITDIPTAAFSFEDACTNADIHLVNESQGNPDTYTWDFGDGVVDQTNTANPNYAFTQAGTYTVTLTAGYAASGCTHSISHDIVSFPRTIPNFLAAAVCLNEETEFTDATTNDPIQWTYRLDENNVSIMGQDFAHTYQNPGTYNVTLITTNQFGCTDSITKPVVVNVLPIAGFEPNVVCLGVLTEVTNTSQGATNYIYDWQDGTITTTGTHTYLVDGTYEVEQIAITNNGCRDTFTTNVVVNPNPVAAFTASIACFGYATIFNDLSSADVLDWQWDFGDNGAIMGVQDAHHIYTAEGNYSATLTVMNEFGCTDIEVMAVSVLAQPIAAFTNNLVCAESDIQFTNTSQGNPILQIWDFGDGSATSTDLNPSHVYDFGGAYDVTLIVGNSVGCIDTLEQVVNVYTVPQVDFDFNTVCIGSVTAFEDLTVDAANVQNNYHWDFGDGNTSYMQNPTYIYQNPGTYTVTLTVGNDSGCDSSFSRTYTVNAIPVADFEMDTVCMGVATTFTDISSNSPIEWIWDFGDGTIINGQAVEQYAYAAPGNYLVNLMVNGGGMNCQTNTYKIVTVYEVPVAQMNVDNSLCIDQPLVFESISTISNGVISSNHWTFGNGDSLSVEQGQLYYTQAGNYTIQLVVTANNGCQDSIAQMLTVNELPMTGLNTQPIFICPGRQVELAAGSNLSYEWVGPNGFQSTEQVVVIEQINSSFDGEYYLTVIDANGCRQMDSVTVQTLNGNQCIEITQLLSPNNDGLNDTWVIQGIDNLPNVEVKIYNRWGSLLYVNSHYMNDWKGEVNTGMTVGADGIVPTGTYFYIINLNDGITEPFNGYLEVQY